MADPARRGREAALGVVGAVTLGAMAAGFAAPPAIADDPDHPSWRDVRDARSGVDAAEGEADLVTDQLVDLQDRADGAGRTAAIAVERYHRAQQAEQAARDRAGLLAAQADAAAATARTSRIRAGLLAAAMVRGGGDPRLQLLLDGGSADDLLHRVSTATQLSAGTQAVYDRATADRRTAEAVGAQAESAIDDLGRLTDAARDAMDRAQAAAAAAAQAVGAEQQQSDRLTARLAGLRGESVRVAAEYVAGLRAARPALGATGGPSTSAPAPTTRTSSPPAVEGTRPRATERPSASPDRSSQAPDRPSAAPTETPRRDAAPSAATTTSPAPTAPPAATPASPPPAPAATAGPPNSAQAAAAVAFARDQVGDAYRFGGAGPSEWDCSGLTMQAYAAIGIAVGGHSATAQYRLAAAQGRLAPIAQAQVGDLVFYSDGGGEMYHVAIYSGSGRMIEAPYPGVPVREVLVRGADRVAQVARPTAG